MSTSAGKTVAVFGSSKPSPDSDKYWQALDLGQALGAAGYVVANGGYGGTMAASAQGARAAGGKTIGVTCAAFRRSKPNSFIDKELLTGTPSQRLDTLIHLADAWVVLPGSTGTLLELSMCWELTNKQFLPAHPIICLSDYWKPVFDLIVATGETDGSNIYFVHNVSEVITTLKDTIG